MVSWCSPFFSGCNELSRSVGIHCFSAFTTILFGVLMLLTIGSHGNCAISELPTLDGRHVRFEISSFEVDNSDDGGKMFASAFSTLICTGERDLTGNGMFGWPDVSKSF